MARDVRLTTWGLATFHAAAIMLVLLITLHANSALSGLLQSFNTWVGLYLFGALWLASWLGTAHALKPVTDALERGARPLGLVLHAAANGALWGAVSGLLFLLALFALSLVSVVNGLPDRPPNPEDAIRSVVSGFGLFLTFGGIAASLIGAVVGLALGLLDWLLLVLAECLPPPARPTAAPASTPTASPPASGTAPSPDDPGTAA